MAGGARQIINAPDFTPLPNFLWDAAQQMDSSTPHWRQGVTWQETCGDAATLYDECIAVTGTGGAPTPMGSLQPTVTQRTRGATSFSVYAEFDCAPVGNMEELNQAEQALARHEGYLASRAFWTGQSGQITSVFPHLAADAVVTDTNGYVLQTAASPYITGGDDVAVVLGALEAQLASCYGGQGVIHVPLTALPTFVSRALVKPDPNDSNRLKTLAGNLVVPGAGYTGSAPDGSTPAAGGVWIYATGALFGFRSDVFVRDFPGTYDRAEGTIKKIASRTYLFGWECCHFGALLDIGVPT